MKKRSLGIKRPAWQQPWQLENLGLVLFTESLHNCKAGKEVKTPIASYSAKQVSSFMLCSWLLFCFLLYQAHYLAAKGPN